MSFRVFARIVAALAALIWSVAGYASDTVPRQVHLIEESDRLLASNVKFNRFDVLKLNAREQIVEKATGEAVIIVITNQRVIGYGILSGWKHRRLEAGERINSVTAEDFAGLVTSNKRYLNFNGQTGFWGERKRGVGE